MRSMSCTNLQVQRYKFTGHFDSMYIQQNHSRKFNPGAHELPNCVFLTRFVALDMYFLLGSEPCEKVVGYSHNIYTTIALMDIYLAIPFFIAVDRVHSWVRIFLTSPSPVACTIPSSTIKMQSSKGRFIMVSTNLTCSSPVTNVHGVLSNRIFPSSCRQPLNKNNRLHCFGDLQDTSD